jgi:hypothetical protein
LRLDHKSRKHKSPIQGDHVKVINSYTLVTAVSFVVACKSVPSSVREYAAALPGRADGQYAVLDTPIKKQLILMDALLPCAIDVADKKKVEESPACKCSKASSADWTADCKAWLGSHALVASPPDAAPGAGSGAGSAAAAGSAATSTTTPSSN